jgi:hypothetical protein
MIRIFLVCFVIVGCFASFARNEWGMFLRHYSEFFLGFTYLAAVFPMFKKETEVSTLGKYSNLFEAIGLFLFALSFVMKFNHWMYTGPVLIIGVFILIVTYLIRIAMLAFGKHESFGKRFILISIHLGLITVVVGLIFKIMHWPFGQLICLAGSFWFIVNVVLSLLLKSNFNGKRIRVFKIFSVNWSNSYFVWIYFSIWSAYVFLAGIGVAPGFYSKRNPYEYDKLIDKGKHQEAEMLLNEYENLLTEIENKK